jgi:hypothetical protein
MKAERGLPPIAVNVKRQNREKPKPARRSFYTFTSSIERLFDVAGR